VAAAICSIACSGWVFGSQMLLNSYGAGNPYLTQCVTKPNQWRLHAEWHQNRSDNLSTVHECDRRQTARPRYAEVVAIGGIACAREILPNNAEAW